MSISALKNSDKIIKCMTGRKFSIETKQKISIALTGK